jgi:hypothetical protein
MGGNINTSGVANFSLVGGACTFPGGTTSGTTTMSGTIFCPTSPTAITGGFYGCQYPGGGGSLCPTACVCSATLGPCAPLAELDFGTFGANIITFSGTLYPTFSFTGTWFSTMNGANAAPCAGQTATLTA